MPAVVLKPETCCSENKHPATKLQDHMYKITNFLSLLSATHGNRAVQILANP